MQNIRHWTFGVCGISLLGIISLVSSPSLAESQSKNETLTTPRIYAATASLATATFATGLNVTSQSSARPNLMALAAKASLEKALQRAAAQQDLAEQQRILLHLALVEYRLGQLEPAQQYLNQAEQLGPLTEAQTSHRNLTEANILLELGQMRAAESLLAQVERDRLMPEAEQRYQVALAQLHRFFGRYAPALAAVDSALAIPAGDVGERALAFKAQGDVHWDLAQMPAAEGSYQQALDAYTSIQDPIGQGRVLQRLGWIYQDMQRWDEAENAYEQALRQADLVNDGIGRMTAQQQLAQIALKRGQTQRAERALEAAISQERPSPAWVRLHLLLGETYFQQKRFDQALELYDQIETLEEFGASLDRIMLRRQRGEVYLLQGKLSQAEGEFRGAIATFEDLRPGLWDQQKVTLFDAHATLYDRLQQVLIAQNRPEQALVVSEQSRARAFTELLSQRLAQRLNERQVAHAFSEPVTKELQAQLEQAKSIATAPPQLAEIQQIARTQQATLVQYSVIQPLTSDSGGSSDETTIVHAPEQLLIWVIQPTGEIDFHQVLLDDLGDLPELSPGSPLGKWVARERGQIDVRGNTRGGFAFNDVQQPQLLASSLPEEQSTARDNPALQEFHRVLIAPIAELLPTDPMETVVFIPHKALLTVPFAALQDQQGQYLVEQHTPLISTSIQALALAKKKQNFAELVRRSEKTANALVIGNPTMPSLPAEPGQTPQPLVPLPGAEFEAKQISPLLGTEPLIGAIASEPTVTQRMPTAPILHFATHGLFDDQQGLNSSLALTPGGSELSENGFLTAEEIMNLELQADLAVLSACDTGRGAITGDGVVGLTRAFFAAGVPSVLSSLWPVADFSTAELMEQFYVNLQTEPDKAQALRQAMLTTMEEYPDPADWGAFILMGQP